MLILFYNEFSDCNNKSLYIPSVTTLSEKSSIRIIADKNVVDHVPKNAFSHGRSHICTYGAATRPYSFT